MLLAEFKSERLLMTVNDEPWDFNEAKKLKVWLNACKDELVSIEKNNTWKLCELPIGVRPMDSNGSLRLSAMLMEVLISLRLDW